MTQQSEERPIPQVDSEEDQPFRDDHNQTDINLSRETDAFDIRKKRFSLGSSTLGWCICLMLLCVILSIFVPENDLINKGFDAFKLIVMTILGYIFGSNKE